jgi:hypothetical protein
MGGGTGLGAQAQGQGQGQVVGTSEPDEIVTTQDVSCFSLSFPFHPFLTRYPPLSIQKSHSCLRLRYDPADIIRRRTTRNEASRRTCKRHTSPASPFSDHDANRVEEASRSGSQEGKQALP